MKKDDTRDNPVIFFFLLQKDTYSLIEESLAHFLLINHKCNQMKVSKQDEICNRGNS